MDESRGLDDVALDAMRKRLTEILPNQIRECASHLTEEQIWWRPNDESNSVGNLILHLSGSMRHYICHSIGGLDYRRDRAAEFSEKGPVSKEALLLAFEDTIQQIIATFQSFDKTRLLEPGAEPSYLPTIFDQIYGASMHMSLHAGQIIFITKMFQAGAIDEIWKKAHNLK